MRGQQELLILLVLFNANDRSCIDRRHANSGLAFIRCRLSLPIPTLLLSYDLLLVEYALTVHRVAHDRV